MDAVFIVDVILITFGIPILLTFSLWSFKEHINLKTKLKIMEVELEQHKKLSDERKEEILQIIKEKA